MGSVIINLFILVIIFGYCGFVVYKKYQDKKNGKTGCGCCGGNCSACYSGKKEQENQSR